MALLSLFPRTVAPCLFLLLLSLAAGGLSAQEPRPSDSVTSEQVDVLRAQLQAGRERVDTLLNEVDPTGAQAWLEDSPLERLQERIQAEGLSDPERALWQEALDHEQAGAEQVRQALNRVETAAAGPQRLNELLARLNEISDALGGEETAAAQRPLSEIEQQITNLSSRHTQSVIRLDQSRQTLSRLQEQLSTQPEALEELRREREQALTAVGALQTEATLQEAQDAVARSLERRFDARILALQLASQTLPPRIETLQLEVPVLALEQRWLGQRLASLRLTYNQRASESLRQLTGRLQTLVEERPELEQRRPDELGQLRRRINRIEQSQDRIRTLQADRETYQSLENDLNQALTTVRERLEVGDLNEALGSLFMEEQRRLRSLEELELVLREVEQELSRTRLQNITLREELRALPSSAAGAGPADTPELNNLRREATAELLQTQEALVNQLRQVESRLRAVVDLVDELQQILRETLIWWPSHARVDMNWLTRIPPAMVALLDPASWLGLHENLIAVTVGSPVRSVALLLLVALLLRASKNTRRHLANLAEKTRHRYTDNITLTLKALARSVLRALPTPLLLTSLAWRLEQVPEAAAGVDILVTVLYTAAVWWLAGHLFLLLTSRNGIVTVHFQWRPALVRRLRRHLAWYLPTQFLLIIFLALTFVHPSDLVLDVLGRAGLVASAVLSGLFAWRLLAPYRKTPLSPQGERRRRLLRMGAALYALTLVALSLAGYLLTVNELLQRSISTVVVLGLVWLGYRIAARALILSELRLRLRYLREERAQAEALESNSPVGEGGLDLPDPHLSMEDVNQQTRTLVNLASWAAFVAALLWVWADILPALTWLDNFTLWSRTSTVGETEIISQVTLQDGLVAALLAFLLLLAARNLPGLVEILLTRGTEMDANGRYTVSILLRYVLLTATVVSVFSLLGLRWSELQWLVAALSLGLGFGLQEVVANFVSGLIMLFERPVRVGDTITIGEFSGTVGRIRTRATTLIDWDNREVVVPNKNFITERLINWTLSDTTTRIVLPVGVSYDADVDQVMDTMQQIAEQHPLVLEEPPPQVFFLQFAASALNFELRVYVSQLSDRLDTISDLHRSIVTAFRELGIDIAYPQMDLHIRDMPAAMEERLARRAARSEPPGEAAHDEDTPRDDGRSGPAGA